MNLTNKGYIMWIKIEFLSNATTINILTYFPAVLTFCFALVSVNSSVFLVKRYCCTSQKLCRGMFVRFTGNSRGMFVRFTGNSGGMFVRFTGNSRGMFVCFTGNSRGTFMCFTGNSRGMLVCFTGIVEGCARIIRGSARIIQGTSGRL